MRKTSSHVFGGVTAPPLDAKAKEAYRKQWGFDPPEAHVLLLPPEYRQGAQSEREAETAPAKPKSGAQIEADRLMAEAKGRAK